MTMVQNVVEKLPFWAHLSSDERTLVLGQAALRTFDAGQLIGGSDSSCTGMFLIVQGGVRVSLLSEEGKEITLFRIGCGECCVTTASCVIRQISFGTLAAATEKSELLIVPIGVCEHLASNIFSSKSLCSKWRRGATLRWFVCSNRCFSDVSTSVLPTIWLSDARQRGQWSSGSLKTSWRVTSTLPARR